MLKQFDAVKARGEVGTAMALLGFKQLQALCERIAPDVVSVGGGVWKDDRRRWLRLRQATRASLLPQPLTLLLLSQPGQSAPHSPESASLHSCTPALMSRCCVAPHHDAVVA